MAEERSRRSLKDREGENDLEYTMVAAFQLGSVIQNSYEFEATLSFYLLLV